MIKTQKSAHPRSRIGMRVLMALLFASVLVVALTAWFSRREWSDGIEAARAARTLRCLDEVQQAISKWFDTEPDAVKQLAGLGVLRASYDCQSPAEWMEALLAGGYMEEPVLCDSWGAPVLLRVEATSEQSPSGPQGMSGGAEDHSVAWLVASLGGDGRVDANWDPRAPFPDGPAVWNMQTGLDIVLGRYDLQGPVPDPRAGNQWLNRLDFWDAATRRCGSYANED